MADGKLAAEEMSKDLKEISVAEFFEKNRHLLGYENTTKAMLTIVKELVDNSLDACEEARILPSISLTIKELEEENRFLIKSEDNGPGIVEEKLPMAFGKLLYGSKFHRLKQSRGIQGLGAHGAIMFSQLTTGKPTKIISSIGNNTIGSIDLMIDVTKNEPHVLESNKEKNPDKWHGLSMEMEVEGRYIEKGQSILEYLKQTAIMNPYAKINYSGPGGKITFARGINELPPLPREIKPHPYGVELGILIRYSRQTSAKSVTSFLKNDFSRVGGTSALQICSMAKIDPNKKPQALDHAELTRLHKAMQEVKLMSPPTDCLSTLGEEMLIKGLKKEIEADQYLAISRPPSVYRGRPFAVECGIAYGGSINPENSELYRFANKVPLLYHQGDCAITEAVKEIDWKRYGLQQPNGSLPAGPMIILVHLASVWVPFTSEGKQAISSYPEITKEIKLALQDAGRVLKKYISGQRRSHDLQARKSLFENYIPEAAISLSELSGTPKDRIEQGLEKFLKKGLKDIITQGMDEEEKEVEKNEKGRSEEES
jgi:DNA topoisomerase VI subunit B